MKVFVVLRSYSYEADEILCVCSTTSRAERLAKQGAMVYPSASVRVVSFDVDGTAPWESSPPVSEGKT